MGYRAGLAMLAVWALAQAIALPTPCAAAEALARPRLGLRDCLEALQPGRTPDQAAQLARALQRFAAGHPDALRCFVHAADPTPGAAAVAAVQRRLPSADVLLIDAAAGTREISQPHRREPACSAYVATPLALTSSVADDGAAAAAFEGASAHLPAAWWWPEAPFAALGPRLYLHVGVDLDFCAGFEVWSLRGGRWSKASGGVIGCHVANGNLDGLGDFDGDGQPERLQLAALPDYPGDGAMAAVHALVPIAPGQRIDWQAAGVRALYAARWAEVDRDPDPPEAEPSIEACVAAHAELAQALHAGALAGVPAVELRAFAEATLGALGQGSCWRCQASGAGEEFAVRQCRSAARATRCVIEAGVTGRAALQRCWRGRF